MKLKKYYGMTLIEAMLAVSISSMAGLTVIQQMSEQNKKDEAIKFIDEVLTIINGIDHRITIDGYDPILWKTTSWNNETQIVNNLLSKELVSKDGNCTGGEWEPTLNSEKKAVLIPCDLWKNRRSYDLDMKAGIVNDASGFIQKFDLIFSFNNVEEFEDNFLYVKSALKNSFAYDQKELSGLHNYEYVDKNNTNNIISTMECTNDPLNCSIKASFERSGGNEYLRADGGNSMIGEHITFIETKGQAPMKCIRWTNTQRNGSGVWSQKLDDHCGIGVYKDGSKPVVVDTVSDTGTFKNVVLDQTCTVFEWNGSQIIDSGRTSPCGMTNNGTELYQTISNNVARNAYIKNIFNSDLNSKNINSDILNTQSINSNNADIKVASIEQLTTKVSNIEALNVLNALEVNGIAEFKNLVTMQNNVGFNGLTTFNKQATFNDDVDIAKSLSVDNNIDLVGALNIDGEIKSKNNISTTGSLNVNGDSQFNSNLNVSNNLSSRNNYSSYMSTTNGRVGRDLTIGNNVKSKSVTSTTGNITTVNSNRVNASVGNFTNINNAINGINGSLNNLNNKINNTGDYIWIKHENDVTCGQSSYRRTNYVSIGSRCTTKGERAIYRNGGRGSCGTDNHPRTKYYYAICV